MAEMLCELGCIMQPSYHLNLKTLASAVFSPTACSLKQLQFPQNKSLVKSFPFYFPNFSSKQVAFCRHFACYPPAPMPRAKPNPFSKISLLPLKPLDIWYCWCYHKCMKEKHRWPTTSIRLNPEVHQQARIAAVTQKRTLGQWLEEAIAEKIEKEKEK